MSHIDNYTIDGIIINMNYKLLDLENMEQSLNDLYFSTYPKKIEAEAEEAKKTEQAKETEKQKAQELEKKTEDIKEFGYKIGNHIDKLRTNNKSEEPLTINNINVNEELLYQRKEMIATVKEIYTKSEEKKNIERELYYLKYIRIILKKLEYMKENSIDISIDMEGKLKTCEDLIGQKEKKLTELKEETIWNPTYKKIEAYIESAKNEIEIIKTANDIEKYIKITDSWISSIIKENNEYKRRMLIDIITQNIICSTKKSL
tara:strand:- start:3381 stop:4160 length:780 start_codon:yes stop_codon:yes gene_type:complete